MCRSGSDSGSGSGSGSSDSSAEEEGHSDESVSDYEPSHKVKSRKPSNKYSFHLDLGLLLLFYVVGNAAMIFQFMLFSVDA